MTKVLIVEDNRYMADFFAALFRSSGQYECVGTLRDAAQTEMFCHLNPVDLILMDVQTLHGHSGLAAARVIKQESPRIRIIVVTSLVDDAVLQKAREVGADSLWYKDHGGHEILEIVERTLAGEHLFPDKAPNVEIGRTWSDELSDTQKKILRLYIQGNSYSAIARQCYIEETTVKYHMEQMVRKCGFKNKQQLIAAAIESTIITTLEHDG